MEKVIKSSEPLEGVTASGVHTTQSVYPTRVPEDGASVAQEDQASNYQVEMYTTSEATCMNYEESQI